MENQLLFGFYVVLGFYLVYRLLRSFNRPKKESHDEINEILTSEKYKVKGQYEE